MFSRRSAQLIRLLLPHVTNAPKATILLSDFLLGWGKKIINNNNNHFGRDSLRSALSSCLAEKPNVTITAEMVERGGGDFWVVSCISSGGRPETRIHSEPVGGEDVQNESGSDSYTQTHRVVLPAAEYHGQDVTCVFRHPKFSHAEQRVVTLPSFCEYRLSELDSLEFAEENTDVLSFRCGRFDRGPFAELRSGGRFRLAVREVGGAAGRTGE